MSNCECKFVYQGVRYGVDERPVPGTGALSRVYAHAYFCERCLKVSYEDIGREGHTYEKVRYGAVHDTSLDRKGRYR